MASITGLGGIGKTELCRKYVQQHADDYDGNVIWLTAETEEVLQESFIRLAKDILKLSTKDADGGEKDAITVVDQVYNFFSQRKSLFIFDNAESGEVLEKFLPIRVLEKPHVLITSRDRDWEFEGEVLVLHELDEQDAIMFVRKGLDLQEEDQEESIILLVTTLQRFPLALQQAISFIKQQRMVTNYDISSYLKTFLKQLQKNHFHHLITTERIADDEDHGALALQILNIIAYLGADNIPTNLLCEMEADEQHNVLFAIRLLVKYSMVEARPDKGTLSVHRLVQEVARIELKNSQKEEETLREVLELIQCHMGNDEPCVVEHRIVAWNHATKSTSLVITDFTILPILLTWQLRQLQRYKEANTFGTKTLQLLQSHLSPDDVDLLNLELQLTEVHYRQGKYEQCLDNCRDLLGRAKSELGEDHDITLGVEHILALSMNELGKHKEALVHHRNVLKKKTKVYGEDDESTINTVQSLGVCLHASGEYQEALVLYQDVLGKYKALLGGNHKNVFRSTQNLALLYKEMGQLDKATEMIRGVYGAAAEKQGQNDRLTLIIGHNLSSFLVAQGNYEEAFQVATDVFNRRKEVLGPDHQQTLTTWNNLGWLLRHQEKFDEALVINQSVYDKLIQRYGPNHPDTLEAKMHMSCTWAAMGMEETALMNMRQVLEAQKAHFGMNHYETLTTQYQIGKLLEEMDRSEEALKYFEEVEEITSKQFGEDHDQLPEMRERIAIIKAKIE